jgi:hypothetical protein
LLELAEPLGLKGATHATAVKLCVEELNPPIHDEMFVEFHEVINALIALNFKQNECARSDDPATPLPPFPRRERRWG